MRFSETYPLGAMMRSTPTASKVPLGPVPRAIQRTNMTSPFVACSIGSARKSGMKSSRSMIRLAYSCGPRTGRVVCGQYPAVSGMAIAGTLASPPALFGFTQLFPQSSIRYGPRCFGDSPSALQGDIRSVSAAPVTVSETVRRTLTSLVADMVHLLCFGTLHNAALSCHVPEADRRVGSRDEHVRSGAVCRLRRR